MMNDFVKAGMFALLGIAFAIVAGVVSIYAIGNFRPFPSAIGHGNMRSVPFPAFMAEEEFSGVVIATEDLGVPQSNQDASPLRISIPAPERAYNVLILQKNGTYCIVRDFPLGRHAKDDFATLIGKEERFPDALWPMRASALFD